jgi:hypothetical protein
VGRGVYVGRGGTSVGPLVAVITTTTGCCVWAAGATPHAARTSARKIIMSFLMFLSFLGFYAFYIGLILDFFASL